MCVWSMKPWVSPPPTTPSVGGSGRSRRWIGLNERFKVEDPADWDRRFNIDFLYAKGPPIGSGGPGSHVSTRRVAANGYSVRAAAIAGGVFGDEGDGLQDLRHDLRHREVRPKAIIDIDGDKTAIGERRAERQENLFLQRPPIATMDKHEHRRAALLGKNVKALARRWTISDVRANLGPCAQCLAARTQFGVGCLACRRSASKGILPFQHSSIHWATHAAANSGKSIDKPCSRSLVSDR